MLNIERRKDILDLILKMGSVKVIDLAKKYNVGEATIRRDLKYLAEEYGVNLTYGGAFIKENHNYRHINEINISNKLQAHYEEKHLIARKAAKLIEDGDTIALNAGSTVQYILDYLENITSINIITLSLNVAVKAANIPFANVYLPGGKLRNMSGALHGPDAENFLKNFSIDKCFFGVAAVSLKRGITHPALEEVHSNRILLEISEKKYLVCDSSKFDCISLVKMADLDELDAYIVDDKFSEDYRKFASLNKIEII